MKKDQTTRAFQIGGYNPPSIPQQPYMQPTQVNPQTGTYTLPGTGIAGYQVPSGTPTGFTPYGGATPYFQPVQFTGAQYQTALQTTNLPTFAETIGSKPGQYDELRTYINDAGQTLQIPFKDGRPIYPIPEGYRPIGDEPAPEEEETTVAPTLGETQVIDDGGGDRDSGYTVGGVDYGSAENATKANADIFGAKGSAGIDLAGVAAALGVPGAAMAIGKGMSIGATDPMEAQQQGYGALTLGQLNAAQQQDPSFGYTQTNVSLTNDQIEARKSALENVGVVVNGVVGYNVGNAVPGIPGAVMGVDGISRDYRTGAVARDANGVPAYKSFKDFFDRVTMSKEEKEAQDARSKAEAERTAEIAAKAAEQEAGRMADTASLEAARSAIEQSDMSDEAKATATSQVGLSGASASGTESAGFGPGTEGYKGEYDAEATGEDGPGESKIVCTAMNNAYGFGSFRQTVWLQHSKNMDPAYQKGYHRIFRPLIKFAYNDQKWYNMLVRNTLEGIARRRTADIWMQKHNKRHLRGAIERAILEPLCYIVGKIK